MAPNKIQEVKFLAPESMILQWFNLYRFPGTSLHLLQKDVHWGCIIQDKTKTKKTLAFKMLKQSYVKQRFFLIYSSFIFP